MSRIVRNKDWWDKRSKKILSIKSKGKKLRKIQGKKIHESQFAGTYDSKKGSSEYSFIAPKIFSVLNNYIDTTIFFNEIIDKLHSKRFNTTFFIDLSRVEDISVESLMYLVALIYDAKSKPHLRITIRGNFPKRGEAAKKFIQSGFLSYVKTNKKDIKPESERIQIIRGTKTDADTAKKVCIYVQGKCGLSKIDTIPLYNVLVELMGNTFHHAYKDRDPREVSANSWYLYAEEQDKKIVFTFLDTGLGIPKTVNKKWHEKTILLNLKNDSEYISSALKGEFRSETKEKNRGKGLPQIAASTESGLIDNVHIYSGKGLCKIMNNSSQHFILIEENNKIFGTLFSWEINKRR